ncbi:MAG: phosphorylase [Alphaproteobacteria bacterium]|nr:phosphorylase [Alphaproteobacteria bacterium]
MTKPIIGILCGFEAEAMVARKLTPHVACSGAVEALAFERAEQLVKQGATALVSFGVAGGLDPQLTNETIIIAKEIAGNDNQRWVCDAGLITRFKTAAPHGLDGAVYGSSHLVPTPSEKKKLHATTGCVIVDMESHVVATIATKYGLPFAVLRGVSDSVEDGFPDAALSGISPDGSTNMNAVYKSLLRNPFQIPALLKLFKHTGIALKQLDTVVTKL